MPKPDFPPNTLSDEGNPLWIDELANADPNHAVHVVRDLEPAEALKRLGANPESFRSVELPDSKPSDHHSLPSTALGIEPGTGAALLAGRIGDWTFVYDDSGYTNDDTLLALSDGGRSAATSYFSINADASLTYAVDGEQLAWVNIDDLDLETDLPEMPAELRAAFEAAGTVDLDYLEPGEADYSIAMRAVCTLSGLTCTIDDIRRIPLLGVAFG
ncbi:DUF6461 domain-containing protein [Amycolatopsis sp. CA-230715]|uniref:DUF6461 domain-containing protein n=1 Tax=Amycolatopsis sp. CA-230715 TaxID=2745196 RepID=UPI001C034A18|nr:DUF6461 domain-containing protein [Amycolatopsis sp. CA-230715]QWF83351.1 hypothetical protein HUW46_06791 [Amycolatopsis sp. CA-230715]